jgi:sporulation protein YqfC
LPSFPRSCCCAYPPAPRIPLLEKGGLSLMPRKPRLAAKLASILELPGEVLLEVSRVTFLGRERLLVENHRGLLGYTAEQILVNTPQGRLQITGANLNIGAITPEQVTVDGQIAGCSYVEADGRG